MGIYYHRHITPRARRVLTAVKREVRVSSAPVRDIIFTELLKSELSTALKILRRMGYMPHMLAQHIRGNLEQKREAGISKQRLIQVVEFAFAEGSAISHDYLGTEHLLLGVLCDEELDSEPATYGILLSRAREEVVREFSAP